MGQKNRPLQVEACPDTRNTQTDGAPDDITDTSDIIKSFSLMDEGFESELFPVIMIPVYSCVHLCAMFQHVSA